jgi:hypothetical protein
MAGLAGAADGLNTFLVPSAAGPVVWLPVKPCSMRPYLTPLLLLLVGVLSSGSANFTAELDRFIGAPAESLLLCMKRSATTGGNRQVTTAVSSCCSMGVEQRPLTTHQHDRQHGHHSLTLLTSNLLLAPLACLAPLLLLSLLRGAAAVKIDVEHWLSLAFFSLPRRCPLLPAPAAVVWQKAVAGCCRPSSATIQVYCAKVVR